MKLLLIDDDLALCELLDEYLTQEGFDVHLCHDGTQALAVLQAQPGVFDAIILDVMLPGMNGFDVLKNIPADNPSPILMLTARGEDTDTVLGLELGADDYVAKPVSPRVLVARLRALIRRSQPELDNSILIIGDLHLNQTNREITIAGQGCQLTGAEFNVLSLLVHDAGQIISRETLAAEGLGRPLQAYDRRIETHIAQIRRKIGLTASGKDRIITVRGAGYLYASEH